MKFLAVLAVLAMAVSAVAIFGAVLNDAADRQATSVTAYPTEYTVYVDEEGESHKITIPVSVDFRKYVLAAGDNLTLTVVSSDATKVSIDGTGWTPDAGTFSLSRPFTADEITASNGGSVLSIEDIKLGTVSTGDSASATATLTVKAKAESTGSTETVTITINVEKPTVDVSKEIHVYGTTAAKIKATFTGNPGQSFKAYSETGITGVTIAPATEAAAVAVTIPEGGNQVTAEISVTADSTYDLSAQTIAVSSTQDIGDEEVAAFFYDTPTNAKVIGYAKDTIGDIDQVIFYSDGSALVKLANNESPVVKAEFGYTVSSKTDTVIVGGEEYLWLDMAGFINAADITKTTLKLTSNFATSPFASFTGAAYNVTLVANDDGAKYIGYLPEITIKTDKVTKAQADAVGSSILKKGLTLNECLFYETSTVTKNLYKEKMSFVLAPKEFLGYNDHVTAENDLIIPSAGTTVEDFIFGLLVDSSNKSYGHWNGIFQVFVNVNKSTVTPGLVNVGSYYQKGAAGVVLENLKSGTSAAADSKYTVYAPTLAQAGDIAIVKVINTGDSVSLYTFAFNVANVDKDTQVVSSGDALSNVKVHMLTNGVYAITGINSSVIITVSVDKESNKENVGYTFGLESVVNTNGLGKAVARLNAFDTPARDDNFITMTGTYYRDFQYGNTPVKVYGNIDNKIQSGEIVYSATVDNVSVAAPGHSGLETSASNNVYRLIMTSGTLGFYAVQGHYATSEGVGDKTEYMIGSEVSDDDTDVDVTGIAFQQGTALNMTVNQVVTLVPVITPSNASNPAVEWTLLCEDGSVSLENGRVTALKETGSATVTIKSVDDPSKTATITITVGTPTP